MIGLTEKANSMFEGPILKRIIIYTLPIIATGVLQLLFNAADLVVVGRFAENGAASIAAVGAPGPVISLLSSLFIGLSAGSGVSVALSLGAKDDESVSKIVHSSMPIALICGIILTVVGTTLTKPILEAMSTPESVLGLSVLYTRIYFFGIIPMIIYNFGASILRAAGDTVRPLIFLSAAGVINIALNIFFVTALNMDVAGVALATVISQAAAAVMVITALMRRPDACRLFIKKIRLYKAHTFQILRLGIPAGIQGATFSISNVILQSSINSFGEVAVSGLAASGSIDSFTWMAVNSFQQTTMNFVGQNYGARKLDRINKIVWACLGSMTAIALILGSLSVIFGKQLLGIYIKDSAEAINLGFIRFPVCTMTYFICGAMDSLTGAIRGMGVSVLPMIITICCACGVRVLWILTVFRIPAMHTLPRLLVAMPISWIFAVAAEFIAFYIILGRRKREAASS